MVERWKRRDAEEGAVKCRWFRGSYLGEVRVGVEPTLVADFVVTLGAGVEVWLAGGRCEVRGLAYRTQGAAGKGSDLRDGVG